MRKALSVMFVVGAATGCSSESSKSADSGSAVAIADGDAAWQDREDPASLTRALDAWERAASANPADAAIRVKLARGWFFEADAQDDAKGFENGLTWAEAALAASGKSAGDPSETFDARDVPALYWYASNLGATTKKSGPEAALAAVATIRRLLERIVVLDESFLFAAGHRFLGILLAAVPSFAGGDLGKSREHFDRALAQAPTFVGTKLAMAENYAVAVKDEGLFVKLLEDALATPDDALPDEIPETRLDKKRASELLAKKSDLF